jgi:hypothetical protein
MGPRRLRTAPGPSVMDVATHGKGRASSWPALLSSDLGAHQGERGMRLCKHSPMLSAYNPLYQSAQSNVHGHLLFQLPGRNNSLSTGNQLPLCKLPDSEKSGRKPCHSQPIRRLASHCCNGLLVRMDDRSRNRFLIFHRTQCVTCFRSRRGCRSLRRMAKISVA